MANLVGKGHLLACPGCARHVRAAESACPFCGDALPESFRAAEAPRRPGVRLSRAALAALGATSLTLATACGSSSGGTQADSGFDQSALPAYGQACPDSGCGPVDSSMMSDGSGADGTAPESGAEAGAGDAGGDADAGAVAAYGGPPDSSASG